MTLQSLVQPILFPGNMPAPNTATPSVGNMTAISASGNSTAIVIQANKAMTITQVEWAVNVLTTNPSTVDVRIETVSAGAPSGTLWAANTNQVSGNITTTGWQTATLGAGATVAVGDVFAVVIKWASGNLSVQRATNMIGSYGNLPYIFQNGAIGAFGTARMCLALSDGSGNYMPYPGAFPILSSAATTFNNTGTRSRGMRFKVPFKCQLTGALLVTSGSLGSFNLVLTDASGTTIYSQAFTGVNQHTGNGDIGVVLATPQTLNPATTYYLLMEPTSSTNTQINIVALSSSALLASMPGGAEVFAASRTTAGSGALTDDNTHVPLIDLMIGKLDDGAGGGGGAIFSRIRTGM